MRTLPSTSTWTHIQPFCSTLLLLLLSQPRLPTRILTRAHTLRWVGLFTSLSPSVPLPLYPPVLFIYIMTCLLTHYQQLAQVSQFGTSPLVDDHMLTPVSSAASPPLPSKIKSQYDHEEESLQYSQQPTPPPHAAMYSPYPEYTLHHASQATSSMTMQPTVAETTPHDFFVQRSPGPEDTNPPPPAEFYLGAFGASSVSVAPKTEPYPTYLHNTAGMESPMDLLRADVNAGSYTHRPMTTTGIAQTPSMPPLLHNSPQEQYNPRPLRKLSPARTASKRDPARKASRRRRNSPTIKPLHQIHEQVDSDLLEDDGYPDEDVTLDDKASPDLQRLWDIRKRYLSRKGNGMWEDILADYYQGENIGNDDKKTQAKAGLQMKVHRTLLKHAVWPQRDVSPRTHIPFS